MLAKIISVGVDRNDALIRLRRALEDTVLSGIETNLDYVRQLIAAPVFAQGRMTTRSLDAFDYQPRTFEVLAAGTQTTVQDYPGRVGFWNVGVPPSGPMDDLSFRLANRALGNEAGTPGLEMTVAGPTLRFNIGDDHLFDRRENERRPQRSTDSLGHAVEGRARRYFAFGIGQWGRLPGLSCLCGGHRSSRVLGQFEHLHPGQIWRSRWPRPAAGRCAASASGERVQADACGSRRLGSSAKAWDEWELGVLYGPHGAPDFFTDDDIELVFGSVWEVHYNSSRTGIRLLGPKPAWARSDGGEAGLAPLEYS